MNTITKLSCAGAALLLFAGTLFTACENCTQVSCGTDPEGYTFLFDGKTLDGWDFDSTYWSVKDSSMVGEVTPETILKRNTFMIKKDLIVSDFDLRVDYRISDRGNSGISYRNTLVDTIPYSLEGYQADIDGPNKYTGQNYEERGREFLALRGQKTVIDSAYVSPTRPQIQQMDLPNDSLSRFIRKGDWNEYRIIAKGRHMQHYINGTLMSDVTDNDPAHFHPSGLLGVQVHVGPPMKVEYKNFRIKAISGEQARQ